jgi:hypothetical protein
MLKLAEGDFGVAVPGVERKDGRRHRDAVGLQGIADEKARRETEAATRRARPSGGAGKGARELARPPKNAPARLKRKHTPFVHLRMASRLAAASDRPSQR